jgi:hypothetical protein
MAILGKNCSIRINNTGLIAESVSLSQSNSLVPIYAIGRAGCNNNSINGQIKNTLSISYLMDYLGEPNLFTISGYKANLTTTGVNVRFDGLSGSFYLESLSFNLQPNSAVIANAGFVNFDNITGHFTGGNPYNVTGFVNYRSYNGFSSFITNSNRPILDLDYQFQASLEPIYRVGQKTPYNVILNNSNENIKITMDNWTGINFYGSGIDKIIASNPILTISNLSNISGSGNFTFDLTNAKMTEISTEANPTDIARTTYSFINYI